MNNQSLTLPECGFILTSVDIDQVLHNFVANERFEEIDNYFTAATSKDGFLFNFLSSYEDFREIEFIISLRDSNNEWEEDGIWHDDGSRKLAFSLSLIDSNNIEGGKLEIRKIGSTTSNIIVPFNFGEIVIFKTGQDGFEHKINKVTKGRRLIIAGWCS